MSTEANLTPVRVDNKVPEYICLQIADFLIYMHDSGGSWDQVARDLQPYYKACGAVWWNAWKGKRLTAQKANAVLAYWKQPLIPTPVPVMPCPDCENGKVHTSRCNGKPVASVTILAPGEAVAPVERIAGDGQVIVSEPKPHRRQPRTSIEVHRETHARLNELRRPGETWDALLNRLAQQPR